MQSVGSYTRQNLSQQLQIILLFCYSFSKHTLPSFCCYRSWCTSMWWLFSLLPWYSPLPVFPDSFTFLSVIFGNNMDWKFIVDTKSTIFQMHHSKQPALSFSVMWGTRLPGLNCLWQFFQDLLPLMLSLIDFRLIWSMEVDYGFALCIRIWSMLFTLYL